MGLKSHNFLKYRLIDIRRVAWTASRTNASIRKSLSFDRERIIPPALVPYSSKEPILTSSKLFKPLNVGVLTLAKHRDCPDVSVFGC